MNLANKFTIAFFISSAVLFSYSAQECDTYKLAPCVTYLLQMQQDNIMDSFTKIGPNEFVQMPPDELAVYRSKLKIGCDIWDTFSSCMLKSTPQWYLCKGFLAILAHSATALAGAAVGADAVSFMLENRAEELSNLFSRMCAIRQTRLYSGDISCLRSVLGPDETDQTYRDAVSTINSFPGIGEWLPQNCPVLFTHVTAVAEQTEEWCDVETASGIYKHLYDSLTLIKKFDNASTCPEVPRSYKGLTIFEINAAKTTPTTIGTTPKTIIATTEKTTTTTEEPTTTTPTPTTTTPPPTTSPTTILWTITRVVWFIPERRTFIHTTRRITSTTPRLTTKTTSTTLPSLSIVEQTKDSSGDSVVTTLPCIASFLMVIYIN